MDITQRNAAAAVVHHQHHRQHNPNMPSHQQVLLTCDSCFFNTDNIHKTIFQSNQRQQHQMHPPLPALDQRHRGGGGASAAAVHQAVVRSNPRLRQVRYREKKTCIIFPINKMKL